jgi:hypothetical protein
MQPFERNRSVTFTSTTSFQHLKAQQRKLHNYYVNEAALHLAIMQCAHHQYNLSNYSR